MSTVATLLTNVGYNLNRTISTSSEPSQAECIAWINQMLEWILQINAEVGSELGRITGTITCAESAITAITAANPGSVTSTAHGFATNDVITISGVVGMTEVNDTEFTITVVDVDTYTIGVDTSSYTAYSSGGYGYKASYNDFGSTSQFAITGISKANPGVVTSVAHEFATGDVVTITEVGGMTEVNDTEFTITLIDADSYSIGVDTSAYTTYTSGGYGCIVGDFYSVAVMTDDDGDLFSGWIEKTNSRPTLQLATEANRADYQPGTTNEPEKFYLDDNNNIIFLDTPDDNYTIKIPYYQTQSISATTDMMPFNGLFDNLIVEAVTTKYLYRTREDLGVEWNWFKFIKERAERIVKLRKRMPIRIS